MLFYLSIIIYEIEVFNGNIERDYDIDAETGAILRDRKDF